MKKSSFGFDYFYGGTEEELIKKGERFCERVSRLMCALCEIAGIPCRMMQHLVRGHTTCEVFIEGKWAFVDPRYATFYIGADGRLLSVEEILADPDVIYRQPEWVYEYLSGEMPRDALLRRDRGLSFSGEEVFFYVSYSILDRDRYHYGWMPSAIFPMPKREEKYAVYAELRKKYIIKHFAGGDKLC